MPVDPDLETRVRTLSPEIAVEALIRGYGGEIYSYLASTLPIDDADEAFAMFCEDVVRGLAAFRGESSYRSWLYLLAKNAAHRLRRTDGRRRKRIGGGGDTAAERLAAEVRSTTTAYRRTDVKDKVRALREKLKPDERELLLLRVDRDLEWAEIAAILGEEPATLRKRFERTKEKLRVLAERAGVLSK